MLPLIPFAFGFIAVVAAFVLAHRLRELEGVLNQAGWEKDRRVKGIVWQMPDPTEEAETQKKHMLEWVFATPEWMHKDKKAVRLVFWLRISFLVSNVAGLVFMFLAFTNQ